MNYQSEYRAIVRRYNDIAEDATFPTEIRKAANDAILELVPSFKFLDDKYWWYIEHNEGKGLTPTVRSMKALLDGHRKHSKILAKDPVAQYMTILQRFLDLWHDDSGDDTVRSAYGGLRGFPRDFKAALIPYVRAAKEGDFHRVAQTSQQVEFVLRKYETYVRGLESSDAKHFARISDFNCRYVTLKDQIKKIGEKTAGYEIHRELAGIELELDRGLDAIYLREVGEEKERKNGDIIMVNREFDASGRDKLLQIAEYAVKSLEETAKKVTTSN